MNRVKEVIIALKILWNNRYIIFHNRIIKMSKLLFLLKNIFFLILGLVILFFVFKDKDFTVVRQKLSDINYIWVFIGMFISTLSNYVRAIRWGILIEPLGFRPKKANLFYAIMIMNLSNLVVLRSGEFMRCWVLKKTDSIPISFSLGAVVLGRVFDFVMLFSIILLAYIFNYQLVSDFLYENIFLFLSSKLQTISLLNIFGILFIIAVPIIFIIFKKNIQFKKTFDFIKRMWEGVVSIKLLKKKKQFIAYTLAIWGLYFIGFYVYLFALNNSTHITLVQGIFVFAASGLAMIAPVQGGIGAYHWMVTETLMLFGMPSIEGFVVATIIHTSSMVLFIMVGGLSLIKVLMLRQNTHIIT